MANRIEKIHLDQDRQNEVLEWAYDSVGIDVIASRLGLHPYEFLAYRRKNPEFADLFDSARRESADLIVDRMPGMASDETRHPGITRNMLETAKWTAAKRNPKTYGEKLDLQVTQSLDISDVLEAAAKRIALPGSAPHLIEASVIEEDIDDLL